MDYKTFDSPTLLFRLQTLVCQERKIQAEVLQLLHEVDARLLYAELGYSSLFDFCTKHLHYTEGSAYRRIQAMRLLKTLPLEQREVTHQKIGTGEVSVTNLALVQGYIQSEKKDGNPSIPTETKIELIQQTEGKSKLAVERHLASLQQNPTPQERVRHLSERETEIRFVASQELMQKLKRAREVLAHVNPSLTYAELFDRLSQEFLKKTGADRTASSPAKSGAKKTKTAPDARVTGKSEDSKPSSAISTPPRNRHIPVATRRAVWARDRGRCTYVHQDSGRACESRFGLQCDHVIPFAHGGDHSLDNLRLRCRAHNQLHARQTGLDLPRTG